MSVSGSIIICPSLKPKQLTSIRVGLTVIVSISGTIKLYSFKQPELPSTIRVYSLAGSVKGKLNEDVIDVFGKMVSLTPSLSISPSIKQL